MAQHLSEEEQIESLKRWWKDNGSQLLLMVALVIGGWFGWQQWQGYRENKAAEASVIYNDIMDLVGQQPMDALNDEARKNLLSLAESLRADYSASQYAHYASLMLARLAVADDELDKAAELLNQVVGNCTDDELVNVVRVRLARVEVAQLRYSEALETLDVEVPTAIAGLYAELRGDIHYYLEDFVAARAAYQAALNNLSEGEANTRPLLELKLNRVLDGASGNVVAADEQDRQPASEGES